MWKENVMEKLESGEMKYETAEEFLMALKKEFSRREEESVKAAELRKMEQRGRTMEEFVQKFKRAARGSGYEGRLLMEEFKREINGDIRRKLMEVENPLTSIKQWYKRAMALDRNWRESKREEERLRGKKETVKIVDDELNFYFHFFFISFHFLFLEQLGLGVISNAVTSVTN